MTAADDVLVKKNCFGLLFVAHNFRRLSSSSSMPEHRQDLFQMRALFRCEASVSDRALKRVYYLVKVISAKHLFCVKDYFRCFRTVHRT